MTKKINTLIHAGYILTQNQNRDVLHQHSIAIDQGCILEIIPTNTCTYSAQNIFHLPEHMIAPGLINMHTHSPMVLLRGLGEDTSLQTWLNQYIWPAERSLCDNTFIYEGTLLAIAEMLRSGTTCFNEHYFFPKDIAQAVNDTGMRACIGIPIINAPNPYTQNTSQAFEHAHSILKDKPEPNISYALAPHAPYTVNNEDLTSLHETQKTYNCPIHIHLHETESEVKQSLKEYGKTPVARLHEHNLINPKLLAVHMTHLSDEDIHCISEQGAHIITCPSSNCKLASGFSPLHKYISHNINLCIGTDGAASNNDLDILQEAHLTALIGKNVAQDPLAINAQLVFDMLTIHAAKALGMDATLGSIEPGKYADIIAVHVEDIGCYPLHNLVNQLIYTISAQQIDHVFVSGKCLYQNKTYKTLDAEHLLEIARKYHIRTAPFAS